LIKKKDQLLGPLSNSMGEAYDKVKICLRCGNVDTVDPCIVRTELVAARHRSFRSASESSHIGRQSRVPLRQASSAGLR
ncbi:hypothetical protein ACC740_38605, partial [Rhizobium ruizarguesonis]